MDRSLLMSRSRSSHFDIPVKIIVSTTMMHYGFAIDRPPSQTISRTKSILMPNGVNTVEQGVHDDGGQETAAAPPQFTCNNSENKRTYCYHRAYLEMDSGE